MCTHIEPMASEEFNKKRVEGLHGGERYGGDTLVLLAMASRSPLDHEVLIPSPGKSLSA